MRNQGDETTVQIINVLIKVILQKRATIKNPKPSFV